MKFLPTDTKGWRKFLGDIDKCYLKKPYTGKNIRYLSGYLYLFAAFVRYEAD